jgi:hypothetical protein
MAPNKNHAPTMPAIQSAFHFPANTTAGRLATSTTAQTTTASVASVMKIDNTLMFSSFSEARIVLAILAQTGGLPPEPLRILREP